MIEINTLVFNIVRKILKLAGSTESGYTFIVNDIFSETVDEPLGLIGSYRLLKNEGDAVVYSACIYGVRSENSFAVSEIEIYDKENVFEASYRREELYSQKLYVQLQEIDKILTVTLG